MSFLLTFLDLLVSGWLFWLVCPLGLFIGYMLLRGATTFLFQPLFLWLGALALLVFRYPAARAFIGFERTGDGGEYVAQPLNWLILAIAYFVIGGIVSTIKYLKVLYRFRDVAREHLAKQPALKDHKEGLKQVIESRTSEFGYALTVDKERNLLYIRWQYYPIGNWWVYWPAYSLSLLLDPIDLLVRRMLSALREAYSGISRKFGV